MSLHQDIATDLPRSHRRQQGLRANASTLFSPGKLLDGLISYMGLKNDAALSRALEISAPMICKIRRRTLPVSAAALVQMHEVSGLSIRDLRALMGDHRRRFGISDDEN